jgi:23S rRNA (adenine2503-C2)-methyltransferase
VRLGRVAVKGQGGLGSVESELGCANFGRVRISLPNLRRARVVGSRSDVWAMSPAELAALLQLKTSGQDLFARLQRPWRWGPQGPPLNAAMRERLEQRGMLLPELRSSHVSVDGATKLVLALQGDAIEAVHMPRRVGRGRVTLCVSSQVGCAMGCSFCATGSMGLRRQLAAGEIVAQVLVALAAFGPRHPSELTLVFMGMGEPLHNFENVARAVQVLCAGAGLGLSPRRITLSTSGLVTEIARLAALPVRPLLAVSLNATTDELRRELMPINRRYPLAELQNALQRYPVRPRERITIEYVLLAGINDTPVDAERLADFCQGFPHHINLIPFNAHDHAGFRAPQDAELEAFARAVLARRPSLLTVRRSRGQDVRAACGQLARMA